MAQNGGIQIIDTFKYSGKRFLDLRKEADTVADIVATDESSIPDGFTKYCKEDDSWYRYNSSNAVWSDTGKWRKVAESRLVLNDDFVYAIVDKDNNLLWGIAYDGTCYQPKGIPVEVQNRFNELACISTDTEGYQFAIIDKLGNVVFGVDDEGSVVFDKGLPKEIKEYIDTQDNSILERLSDFDGIQIFEDENYLFAIADPENHLLFGIDLNGRVVFDKGIPGEVQTRLDQLKGYRTMQSDNYAFAIVDSLDRLLFGIDRDGNMVAPKGTVRVVTWAEYDSQPHLKDTLYVISEGGRTQGAYINDRALNTGEEYSFMREGNVLVYRGVLTSLPKLWIDLTEMQLMVEYPSDYQGPMFTLEDGILFIV